MLRLFLLVLTTALFSEVPPPEALRRLKAGNQRYIADKSKYPNRGQERREMVYSTQKPYAIIISCSDSRVPPEIVFDQGIGDLFVIRNAGNVVDPVVLDSIEYAALYLGPSIIVVMGHENCGAVSAVVEGNTQDIKAVATIIQPAVDEARKQDTKNLVYTSVIDNAKRMREKILGTPKLQSFIKNDHMRVIAAYYSLETGKVYFLED